MCRFLAYWGKRSKGLSHWLISSENSLLKQASSDMSARPNPDGWGFAFRRQSRWKVVKSPRPAFRDEQFKSQAQQLQTNFLFAHVRRKSQGRVSLENTHPFVYQDWVFMHNGNIPDFPRIRAELEKSLEKEGLIQTSGGTDSEFLFYYFLSHFRRYPNCDPYCVLNIVCGLIQRVIGLTAREDQAALALNFLLSNGEYIIGFRKNRSMFYARSEEGLLIASEPLDSNLNWIEIPEDTFLFCESPYKIKFYTSHLLPTDRQGQKNQQNCFSL